MTNATYIATLLDEKDIDLDATFEVTSADGTWNLMSYRVVADHIAIATADEQAQIASILRRIDFANGDVCHFLRHLGGALAAQVAA